MRMSVKGEYFSYHKKKGAAAACASLGIDLLIDRRDRKWLSHG
jgi:hypothetical protein